MAKKKKIGADLEILFHPDLDIDIKEVRILYSLDNGTTWDDYYANKLNPKKYQISMYDLPLNEPMEFYIEVTLRDGRVLKALKEGKNYRVILNDKGGGMYKAQVRIKELVFSHRICIICESIIKGDGIQCETPGCNATYCPFCNRMLPPHSNYCPWDKKLIYEN
ncbi:MAG: hypothetical protein ACTSU2_14270 [Promethearchaeota archaeon]